LINAASARPPWLGRVALRAVVAGVVAAAIAGGVAFAVSLSLPKEYESTAAVIVGSLTAATTEELDVNQRLALTYAELATSSPVLTKVIDRIGLDDDPSELAGRIDVRAPGQGIIRIKATALAPNEAAQIANVVANEILALATPVDTTASRAKVVEPAAVSGSPSSPSVVINTLIAAMLGLALGVGLALLLSSRETPTTATEVPSSVTSPRNRANRTEPRAVEPTQVEPARVEPAPPSVQQLGTAVYVTGSPSLEPGRRYILTIKGRQLQVLGPVDLDPALIALDRPLVDVHAIALDDRLVVTEPGSRSGLALAFMSIAGATTEGLATAIVKGARAAARP
jgi:capsular polysaccharide biosynthesis protein